MTDTPDLEQKAQDLASAVRENLTVPPAIDPWPDLATAYDFQKRVIAALGEEPAGWKVGATNPAAMSKLGVEEPFLGPIMPAAVVASGETREQFVGTQGVEVELAVRLGRDLPAGEGPWQAEDLLAAIESFHAAIEVVGTRVPLDRPATGADAIADLGFNVLFVHGPARAADGTIGEAELAAIDARLEVNGVEAASGRSDIVLGNPLNSLAWLANSGPGLKAGMWVSTGTITGLTPVKPGDRLKAELAGIGSVELIVADA